MQNIDTNRDGFIQYEEFVTWAMSNGDAWSEPGVAGMSEQSRGGFQVRAGRATFPQGFPAR